MKKLISSLAVVATLLGVVSIITVSVDTVQADEIADKRKTDEKVKKINIKLADHALHLDAEVHPDGKKVTMSAVGAPSKKIKDIEVFFINEPSIYKYWDDSTLNIIEVFLQVERSIIPKLSSSEFTTIEGDRLDKDFVSVKFVPTTELTPKGITEFLTNRGLENTLFVKAHGFKRKKS